MRPRAGYAASLFAAALAASAGCSAHRPDDGPARMPVVLPSEAEKAEAGARYDQLVVLMKVSPRADYAKELREVLVKSDRYHPGAADPLTDRMFDEIDAKRWDRCLELARQALDADYTNLWGHFGAMVCSREAGDREAAAFHEQVSGLLVDAIWTTGDGKTFGTALSATSTAEVRAFLQLQGLEVESEGTAWQDGRVYDAATVKDPKGADPDKTATLYFDVTLPWALGAGAPGASPAAEDGASPATPPAAGVEAPGPTLSVGGARP